QSSLSSLSGRSCSDLAKMWATWVSDPSPANGETVGMPRQFPRWRGSGQQARRRRGGASPSIHSKPSPYSSDARIKRPCRSLGQPRLGLSSPRRSPSTCLSNRTARSAVAVEDLPVNVHGFRCYRPRNIVPQNVLEGMAPHPLTPLGVGNKVFQSVVPFLRGPGQQAVVSVRDVVAVDPRRRGDRGCLEQARLVILEVAFALVEGSQLQGDEIDIDAGYHGRQLAPMTDRQGLYLIHE